MSKSVTLLALVPLALVLLGGGCQQIYSPTPGATPPESQESASTTANNPTTPGDEFNLVVQVLNPGIVKFTWEAPKDMDPKTETFFLLHSVKPEPLYPDAFWYRRSGVDREGVWGNIPAGKRYFRICEFKDNQCIRYSKVVQSEVQ